MATAVLRNMTLGHNILSNNCVIVSSSVSPTNNLSQTTAVIMHNQNVKRRPIAPATSNHHHQPQHHQHHQHQQPLQQQQQHRSILAATTNSIINNIDQQQQQQHQQNRLNSTNNKKKIAYTSYATINIQQPASVQRRNARERNRVKQVNNGFANLRQHIPQNVITTFSNGGRGASKKLSKVDTLRIAVQYIRSLEDTLGKSENEKLMCNVVGIGSNNCRNISNCNGSTRSSQSSGRSSYYAASPPLISTCSESSSISPTPSIMSDGGGGGSGGVGQNLDGIHSKTMDINQYGCDTENSDETEYQIPIHEQQFKYEIYENNNIPDHELLDIISSWQRDNSTQ